MLLFILITALALAILFYTVVRLKNMDIWLWNYLLHNRGRKLNKHDGPTHVLFCFVDHYEPQWKTDNLETERARVDRWLNEYPQMAKGHKDADGHAPQHTFFYPEEEYRQEHLDKIQSLCEQGYGETDIHIHHHDDTADNFVSTIEGFKQTLTENHGLLTVDENGNTVYNVCYFFNYLFHLP